MTSSISLVAAGVGVAFVPLSMCQLQAKHVHYVTIKKGGPRAIMQFATRALSLHAPASKFATLVKQELKRQR